MTPPCLFLRFFGNPSEGFIPQRRVGQDQAGESRQRRAADQQRPAAKGCLNKGAQWRIDWQRCFAHQPKGPARNRLVVQSKDNVKGRTICHAAFAVSIPAVALKWPVSAQGVPFGLTDLGDAMGCFNVKSGFGRVAHCCLRKNENGTSRDAPFYQPDFTRWQVCGGTRCAIRGSPRRSGWAGR